MLVIIKNVHFYTSIPNPKSEIVPGTIAVFAGTVPYADTDTFDGFCVSIIWPVFVPKVRSARTHTLDLNYRRLGVPTTPGVPARKLLLHVIIVVNRDIKFHIVLKFLQMYENNMLR